MSVAKPPELEVSPDLIDAVEAFPTAREAVHCGQTFSVSPLAVYGACPTCGAKVKLRSFSANVEVEDLFDAFATWLLNPEAAHIIRERQQQIVND